MSDVGVVYLARQRSGLPAFRTFIESYRSNPAGLRHELTIVWKGFASEAERTAWEHEANDLGARSVVISDAGFDLRAYRVAMKRNRSPYLFFMNSFSQIMASDWLAKVRGAFEIDGVGLAGATGSWESMYSNALREGSDIVTVGGTTRLWRPLRIVLCRLSFLPFPNPHIRTNAFMLRRELMQVLWPRFVASKRGAYLFENGRNSLTRRVQRTGQRAVVVSKEGAVFEQDRWPQSETFRQREQRHLLVADNQTRLYVESDEVSRKRLSRLAWGDQSVGVG